MSLERVIETARRELGEKEVPAGSNQTKYGRAFGWDGVPWCVIFLWWCFREAGEKDAFYGGGKTSSCSALYHWYRERGQTAGPEEIRPGDILLLNVSGTRETQHCGLVTQVLNGTEGWYRTIEGNTSAGAEGDQTGGGCVAQKARHKENVVGVCRPAYGKDEQTDYSGHWAEKSIRWALEKGLMRGYGNGTWKPDQPLTRAELAVVLQRLEGEE